MTVGFFLVDTGSVDGALGVVCAAALVRSVRASMPGVAVVQFTDEQTAAVAGVNEVRRLPAEPMARLRMRHHAQAKGEWLFVDSDVLIQRDVRKVFAGPFDVALTTRNWKHLTPAEGFARRMPFNVGVVFSRTPGFWRAVYDRVLHMPEELQHWMGDQQAICDLVASGPKFTIAYLKGSKYNLPPALVDDADGLNQRLQAKASILHFKGLERKTLLLARIRKEGLCV